MDQEKTFWLLIRRAMLMFVKAIEQRYGLEDGKKTVR